MKALTSATKELSLQESLSQETQAALEATPVDTPSPEAEAEFTLGNASHGQTMRSKETMLQAMSHWKKAAAMGHTQAFFAVAETYMYEPNFVDYTLAAKFYKKAADAGHAESCNQLGRLYFGGDGVQQSDQNAVEYWRLAAEKDQKDALYDLGLSYSSAIYVEKDMAKAIEFYERAGLQGRDDAWRDLAWIHLHGRGVDPDEAKAAQCLRRAVENGHIDAHFDLGMFYLHGIGVEPSSVQAAELFFHAAHAHHAGANLELAKLLEVGDGIKQDVERAKQCFFTAWKRAMEQDAGERILTEAEEALERLGTTTRDMLAKDDEPPRRKGRLAPPS